MAWAQAEVEINGVRRTCMSRLGTMQTAASRDWLQSRLRSDSILHEAMCRVQFKEFMAAIRWGRVTVVMHLVTLAAKIRCKD